MSETIERILDRLIPLFATDLPFVRRQIKFILEEEIAKLLVQERSSPTPDY